jgi:hypothetical protein
VFFLQSERPSFAPIKQWFKSFCLFLSEIFPLYVRHLTFDPTSMSWEGDDSLSREMLVRMKYGGGIVPCTSKVADKIR